MVRDCRLHAEDEHEEQSQYHFRYQTRQQRIPARECSAKPVLPLAIVYRTPAPAKAPSHLGHNIGKEFFCRKRLPATNPAVTRAQMAARDVANRQCHGKHSQTEGNSDARESRIPLL